MELKTCGPGIENRSRGIEKRFPELKTSTVELKTRLPEMKTRATEWKTAGPELNTGVAELQTGPWNGKPMSWNRKPAPRNSTPGPGIESPGSGIENRGRHPPPGQARVILETPLLFRNISTACGTKCRSQQLLSRSERFRTRRSVERRAPRDGSFERIAILIRQFVF